MNTTLHTRVVVVVVSESIHAALRRPIGVGYVLEWGAHWMSNVITSVMNNTDNIISLFQLKYVREELFPPTIVYCSDILMKV